MKIKKVLFIDDSDISENVDTIERKLKSKGFELHATTLNPKSHEFQKEIDGKLVADFDKIKEELQKNHFSVRYDVVACDFCFANDPLNGYDVIKWLINESNSKRETIRKALFVSYSGEDGKFKQNIIQNDELIKLIRLKIHSFFTRQNLSNELSKLLLKEADVLNLSNLIRDELEKHGEHKFKNIYPKFRGKTLSEIAREIESDTYHGIEFQKYMIELTIAHVLELNGLKQ